MSYQLRFTAKANRQFDDLPDEFVDVVRQHLYALAESPTTLSVPIASPPFPPRGQLFHFDTLGAGGAKWFFHRYLSLFSRRDRAAYPQCYLA